jgi:hypothetical protein
LKGNKIIKYIINNFNSNFNFNFNFNFTLLLLLLLVLFLLLLFNFNFRNCFVDPRAWLPHPWYPCFCMQFRLYWKRISNYQIYFVIIAGRKDFLIVWPDHRSLSVLTEWSNYSKEFDERFARISSLWLSSNFRF